MPAADVVEIRNLGFTAVSGCFSRLSSLCRLHTILHSPPGHTDTPLILLLFHGRHRPPQLELMSPDNALLTNYRNHRNNYSPVRSLTTGFLYSSIRYSGQNNNCPKKSLTTGFRYSLIRYSDKNNSHLTMLLTMGFRYSLIRYSH